MRSEELLPFAVFFLRQAAPLVDVGEDVVQRPGEPLDGAAVLFGEVFGRGVFSDATLVTKTDSEHRSEILRGGWTEINIENCVCLRLGTATPKHRK
uniref:Uncharacterized protein n=1 Tax=Marseillevirus LCMAC103 TaxID=2506604 RepID=A0A481YUR2_9VIRU|nr:MAG: hypothetical protein LCMAC103_01020 [Marseillevirus LCMAC103]